MINIIDISKALRDTLIDIASKINEAPEKQSRNFGAGVTNADFAGNALEFTLETTVYNLKIDKYKNDDEGLCISIEIGTEIISTFKKIRIDIVFFRSNGSILNNKLFWIDSYEENSAQILQSIVSYVYELGTELKMKLLTEYLSE